MEGLGAASSVATFSCAKQVFPARSKLSTRCSYLSIGIATNRRAVAPNRPEADQGNVDTYPGAIEIANQLYLLISFLLLNIGTLLLPATASHCLCKVSTVVITPNKVAL